MLLRLLVRAELGDGRRVDEPVGQLKADGVGAVVAHHGAAETTVMLSPGIKDQALSVVMICFELVFIQAVTWQNSTQAKFFLVKVARVMIHLMLHLLSFKVVPPKSVTAES